MPMMSTLSVMVGFASHRRHGIVPEDSFGLSVIQEQGRQLRTSRKWPSCASWYHRNLLIVGTRIEVSPSLLP